MRAPSQIYKWVSHNEYDDTTQKYSCVSSGNSYNLIYSILLWQMHCRNVLCSKGLLNHLWKNSDTGVGKSDFEHSKHFQILFCLICCIFHIHCRVCYIIISLAPEGFEILKCYFFVWSDRLTNFQVCLTRTVKWTLKQVFQSFHSHFSCSYWPLEDIFIMHLQYKWWGTRKSSHPSVKSSKTEANMKIQLSKWI